MNYAVTRDSVPRSRKLVHYNISLTNKHIVSLLSKLSGNCETNCGFQLQLARSQLQLQLQLDLVCRKRAVSNSRPACRRAFLKFIALLFTRDSRPML